MKKRMLSMVLVIVMVMGMLPGTVLATEDAGIPADVEEPVDGEAPADGEEPLDGEAPVDGEAPADEGETLELLALLPEDAVEITDADEDFAYAFGDNAYDPESGWSAAPDGENGYDYFWVNLEAGDQIYYEPENQTVHLALLWNYDDGTDTYTNYLDADPNDEDAVFDGFIQVEESGWYAFSTVSGGITPMAVDDLSLSEEYEAFRVRAWYIPAGSSGGSGGVGGSTAAAVCVGDALLEDGYVLYNNGRVYPADDLAEDDSGYACFSEGVLTLNDYTYEGEGYAWYDYGDSVATAGIYYEGDLEINLMGENTLEIQGDESTGIVVIGDLTVCGEGSLDISSTYSGIYVEDGNVAIEGGSMNMTAIFGIETYSEDSSKANVDISGGSLTVAYGAAGINAHNVVSISGGSVDIQSMGICVRGYQLSLTGGFIKLESQSDRAIDCDTVSISDGTVPGEKKMEVTAPENKDDIASASIVEIGEAHEHSEGKVCYDAASHWTSCTVEGCLTKIDEAPHEPDANGACTVCGYIRGETVYVGGMALQNGRYLDNDGEIVETEPAEGGYAHYADGILTLHDYVYAGEGYAAVLGPGKITAGVFSEENLQIVLEGDSSLTVEDETAFESCGIVVLDPGFSTETELTICGDGTVAIDAMGGVFTYGTLTVDGADLQITEGEVGMIGNEMAVTNGADLTVRCSMNGLRADGGDLLIEDSTVDIMAFGDDAYAMEAKGDITIDNSVVTIDSGHNGIYTEKTVTIKGDETALNIYSVGYGITAGEEMVDIEGGVVIEGGSIDIETGWGDAISSYGSLTIKGGLLTMTAYNHIAATEEPVMEAGMAILAPAGLEFYQEYEKWYLSSNQDDPVTVVIGRMGENCGEGHDFKENPAAGDYASNQRGHWLVCQREGCQVQSTLEVHSYENGACTICGYERPYADIYVGNVQLSDGKYLRLDGKVSTEAPAEGGYAHYAGGVLTLHNYTYKGDGYMFGYDYENGEYSNAGIYHTDGLKIVLEGENSLTIGGGVQNNGDSVYGYGIVGDNGGLTIGGAGSLAVDSQYDNISILNGGIAMEGGNLDLISREGRGIYAADGNVEISGGKLNIESEAEAIYARLDMQDNAGMILISGGTVKAYSENCCALLANTCIDLDPEKVEVHYKNAELLENANDVIIGAPCAHVFAEPFAKNADCHWKPCTNKDCPLAEKPWLYDAAAGYGAHSYTDGSCTVCGNEEPNMQDSVVIGGLQLTSGQYVTNMGRIMETKPATGGYAHYADGVLTLHDFVYEGYGVEVGLTVYLDPFSSNGEAPLAAGILTLNPTTEIILEGENRLSVESNTMPSAGIASPFKIIVGGDGTLEIEAIFGIASVATVPMYDPGLTIRGGDIEIYGMFGLYVDGVLTIGGTDTNLSIATVPDTEGTYAVYAKSIQLAEYLTIAKPVGAQVLNDAGTASIIYDGWFAANVTIKPSDITPSIQLGEANLYVDRYLDANGKVSRTRPEEGGYACLTEGEAGLVLELHDYAWAGEAGNVHTVQLPAPGDAAAASVGSALHSVYPLTIELYGENSLIVNGTAEDVLMGAAVHSADLLTITGKGSLEIENPDGLGMFGSNLQIAGGTTEISNAYAGLMMLNGVKVSGGKLWAEGEVGGLQSIGGYTQTGGEVTFKTTNNLLADSSDMLVGMMADGILSISGGQLCVESNGIACMARDYLQTGGQASFVSAATELVEDGNSQIGLEVMVSVTVSGGQLYAEGLCRGIDVASDGLYVTGGTVHAKTSPEYGMSIDLSKIEVADGMGIVYSAVASDEAEVPYEVIIAAATSKVITYAETENGSVSGPVTASEGDTVVLNVEPAKDYELVSLKYHDGTENHEITAVDGVYSFEMPGVAVTVTAEFGKHEHDWSFSAEGAVITAVCGCEIGTCDAPDQTVTITLNAPADLSYNGEEKTVTVTQSPEDYFGDVPAVVYTSDRKSLGEHSATLTYEGVTAQLTFAIACEHDYVAGAYVWSVDNKACTVTGVCSKGCGVSATATATVTSQQTGDPTCTAMGWTTYTADFAEAWAVDQTKEVQDIPVAQHKWGAYIPDGRGSMTADCENCDAKDTIADPNMKYCIDSVTLCTEGGEPLYQLPVGNCFVKVSVTDLAGAEDALLMVAAYTDDGQYLWMVTETVTAQDDTVTLPVDNTSGKVDDLTAFILDSLAHPAPQSNSQSLLP